MANVDPPIRITQWIDDKGYLTEFAYQFLLDLWRRTGGTVDIIEQITVTGSSTITPPLFGKQDHTPTLESIGFLGTAADKLAYTTGVDTWAETPLTSFARTLIDDSTATDARTTLDVDQAGTDNSTDVTLAGTPDYITIAGQVITRNAIDLTTDVTGDLPVADGGTGSSTASGARTNLGVAIGSDVQAYSANLDEAGTFFGSTDLSAAEAETLSDGSNADSLHVHSTTGLSDVTSGTYTPALTNVTNLDASTAYDFQYVRVGSVVTVSGKLEINPTAASTIELGVSLPVSSDFTAAEECGGTAAARGILEAYAVEADATNNRAQVRGVAAATTNHEIQIIFQYQIL